MRLLPFVLVTVMAVPASPARSLGGDATVVASRANEGALWWRTAPDEPPSPAPLLATDVDMKVTGVVLRAVVRQEFVNPGATWVEGRYVFPLPDDGAVDHLRMRVGDRVIEGVVQERAGAKTTYQRAKQQGRRVSLVEQERPNVFTASVANVPPGASVAIEIEYQQVLRLDDGQVRLRFPMVVAPRYIPGAPLTTQHGPDADGSGRAQDTDEVPDASRVTPAVRHPARGAIDPVSLRIELRPGAPLARLEAPHHRVATAPLEGGGVLVTLAEAPSPPTGTSSWCGS